MIPKKPVPDVIGDGTCFSAEITRDQRSGAAIRFQPIASRSGGTGLHPRERKIAGPQMRPRRAAR
jgi:hypothetical protein